MKTPDTTNAMPSAPSKRKFSSRSTATEAQYERIISELGNGPRNTMQLRMLGVLCPAGRIKELNDKFGYYISSNPINISDEYGFMHRGVALYELIDRPKV